MKIKNLLSKTLAWTLCFAMLLTFAPAIWFARADGISLTDIQGAFDDVVTANDLSTKLNPDEVDAVFEFLAEEVIDNGWTISDNGGFDNDNGYEIKYKEALDEDNKPLGFYRLIFEIELSNEGDEITLRFGWDNFDNKDNFVLNYISASGNYDDPPSFDWSALKNIVEGQEGGGFHSIFGDDIYDYDPHAPGNYTLYDILTDWNDYIEDNSVTFNNSKGDQVSAVFTFITNAEDSGWNIFDYKIHTYPTGGDKTYENIQLDVSFMKNHYEFYVDFTWSDYNTTGTFELMFVTVEGDNPNLNWNALRKIITDNGGGYENDTTGDTGDYDEYSDIAELKTAFNAYLEDEGYTTDSEVVDAVFTLLQAAYDKGWNFIDWADFGFNTYGNYVYLELELFHAKGFSMYIEFCWGYDSSENMYKLDDIYADGMAPELNWTELKAILTTNGGDYCISLLVGGGGYYDSLDVLKTDFNEFLTGKSFTLNGNTAELNAVFDLLSEAHGKGWDDIAANFGITIDDDEVHLRVYLYNDYVGTNLYIDFSWSLDNDILTMEFIYAGGLLNPNLDWEALEAIVGEITIEEDFSGGGGGGSGGFEDIFRSFDDYIYKLLGYGDIDEFDWDTARYVKDLMSDAVDYWDIDGYNFYYDSTSHIIGLQFDLLSNSDELQFDFEWHDVGDGYYSLSYINANGDTNPRLNWGRLIAAVSKNDGKCNFDFPGGVSFDLEDIFEGFEALIDELLYDDTISAFDDSTADAVYNLMEDAVNSKNWQIGVCDYDYYYDDYYNGYIIYICFDLYDANTGDSLYFAFEWSDVGGGEYSLTYIRANGDTDPGLNWDALTAAVDTNKGNYYIEFDDNGNGGGGGGDVSYEDLYWGIQGYIQGLIDADHYEYVDNDSLFALLGIIEDAVENEGWWFVDDESYYYNYNHSYEYLYFYVELYDGSDDVYIDTWWRDLNDDGNLLLAKMVVEGDDDPGWDWDALKGFIIANGGSYDIFGEIYPDEPNELFEELKDYGLTYTYDASTKTITVEGTVTEAHVTNDDEILELDIPSGVTLIWNAEYSGTTTETWYALIDAYGAGHMEMGDEGKISADTGFGIGVGDTITLTVATGEISGISAVSNSSVFVTGGTVGKIDLDGASALAISGGTVGSVRAHGNNNVIYLADGEINDGKIDKTSSAFATVYYTGDANLSKIVVADATWGFGSDNVHKLDGAPALTEGDGSPHTADNAYAGTVTLTFPEGLAITDVTTTDLDKDNYSFEEDGNTIVFAGTYNETGITLTVEGWLAGKIPVTFTTAAFDINVDTPEFFVKYADEAKVEVPFPTTESIQKAIDDALEAAETNGGGTVTVTGNFTSAYATQDEGFLSLDIPENVTLIWNAKYSGEAEEDYYPLIHILGEGSLEMGLSGEITNNTTGGIALVIADDIELTVDEGIISGLLVEYSAIVNVGGNGYVEHIDLRSNAALAVSGGTIGKVVADNRDNAEIVIYVTGGDISEGAIVYKGGNVMAYYYGSHLSKFDTSAGSFTPGENLFNLYTPNLGSYKWSETDPYQGSVTLTLPKGLEIGVDGLTVQSGINALDPSLYTRIGNTIIFAGKIDGTIDVIIIKGTLADGRIEVGYWMHGFNLNIDTSTINVNGTKVDFPTVARIKSAIDNALGAIDPASGDVVKVTGAFVGADETLNINIPSGITLQWGAEYTGTMSDDFGLIDVFGGGNMEIMPDGYIFNNGRVTINLFGSITLTVNTGGVLSISAAGNSAVLFGGSGQAEVIVLSDNATLHVSGGKLGSALANTNGTIFISGGEMDGTILNDGGSAYYTGSSNFVKFNTTDIGLGSRHFTPDVDLFRLDTPVLTSGGESYEYDGTPSETAITATFPEGLTITGATASSPLAEISFDGNTVTFAGTYNIADIILTITGTVKGIEKPGYEGGTIPVVFDTVELEINVNTPKFFVGDDEVKAPTVASIKKAIDDALENTETGTVEVTGKFIEGDTQLEINIPDGKTLVWKAEYSGSKQDMILLSGSGTMRIDNEANISTTANTALHTKTDKSNTVRIILNGGTVACSTASPAYDAFILDGCSSTLSVLSGSTVTGGILASNTNAVIYIAGGTINIGETLISRQTGSPRAYYVGDHLAKFNTSSSSTSFTFTPGENLFCLDDAPAQTINASGDTMITFPSDIAVTQAVLVDESGNTITSYEITRSGSVVTISGNYNKSLDAYLKITAKIAGKIDAEFKTSELTIENEEFYVGTEKVTPHTVAAIETAINLALEAAPTNGTVEVSGKFSEGNSQLAIEIPSTKTLVWNAEYTGSVVDMILLSGSGTMRIDSGANISAIGADTALRTANDSSVTVHIILNGGTVASTKEGSLFNAIILEGGSPALSLLSGTVTGRIYSLITNAVIYVADGNISINNAMILRNNSGSSKAYYVGDHLEKFITAAENGMRFTPDVNLFRLDTAPTLTEIDGAAHDGSTESETAVTATFHSALAITSVTAEPTGATLTPSGNTVTIGGQYNQSAATLKVTGTIENGRIPVTFTSAAFAINVSTPQILVDDVNVDDYTVAGIQTAINDALDAAEAGETVTVTGKFTGADSTLSIAIPSGITLVWDAVYSGNVAGALLELGDAGTFELAQTGFIHNTNDTVQSNGIGFTPTSSVTLLVRGKVQAYSIPLYAPPAVVVFDTATLQNTMNSALINMSDDDSVLLFYGGTMIAPETTTPIRATTSTSPKAYYIGNHAALFSSSAYYTGYNLFRLDTLNLGGYIYSSDTAAAHEGTVTVTFPEGLGITSVTATPATAIHSFEKDGNTIVFAGTYNVTGITLKVEGTLAGGRIPVEFTTNSFSLNLDTPLPAAAITVTVPSSITYGEELDEPSMAAKDKVDETVTVTGTFTYTYSGTLADGDETEYSSTTVKPINPGTYTVTATLVSTTHSGSGTATFTISPKPLTWETSGTAKSRNFEAGNTTVEVETSPTLGGLVTDIGKTEGIIDIVNVVNGTLTLESANVGTWAVTATGFGIEGGSAWKYKAPTAQPTFADVVIGQSRFEAKKDTHYTTTELNTAGWTNGDFVITAASGYQILVSGGSPWDSEHIRTAETTGNLVTFFIRDTATGDESKQTTESYKIDKTAPTATVQYNDNEFRAFSDSTAFNLFFKESVKVTIASADSGSGVEKVEYIRSWTVITDFDSQTWSPYNAPITFSSIDKCILYVRVTDKAGNSVIYYDGLVAFEDSADTVDAGTFYKGSDAGHTVAYALNGNTVKEITETTLGGSKVVVAPANYTVSDTGITFTNAYMRGLEDDAYTFEHIFTVSYYPLGETGTPLAGSDTIGTTEITVSVQKSSQTALVITDPGAKTYGDEPFSLTTTGGNTSGTVTYAITSGDAAEVSANGLVTIKAAGTVYVTATMAGNDLYNSVSSDLMLITIDRAPLTLTADNKSIIVGAPEPAEYAYTVSGLVYGESANNVFSAGLPTLYLNETFDSSKEGTFTIVISGGTPNDNYVITERKNGTLRVSEKEDVSEKISFAASSATYTGAELTHETAAMNSSFTPGANPGWTYSYAILSGGSLSNGKPVGAGAYTVTATYEDDENLGTATATFTINPRSISGAAVVVGETYTYTGSAITPPAADVTVTLAGYTPTYTFAVTSGGTNAGTATLTVTGTGNYTGTATGTFTIGRAEQAALSVTATPSGTLTYSQGLTVGLTHSGGSGDGDVSYTLVSGPATLNGYTLTITGAGTIEVTATKAADTNYNAATSAPPLTITVNPAPIDSVALSVTAPVVGYTPVATASGTGNFTVGAVTWDGNPVFFAPATSYTVRVWLDVNENYIFDTGNFAATINGASATEYFPGLGNTVEVSYTFAATDADTDVPTAPQNLTAAAGNGRVTLTWQVPESNGGEEITGYEVLDVLADDDDTWILLTASEMSYTFTGLRNGTSYEFAVRAINSVGAGAEETATARPTAPPPPTDSEPTKPALTPGNTPAPETETDFVEFLYLNAFGREPDSGGFDHWMERLESGELTGVDIMFAFVFSEEAKNLKLDDEDFVTMLYRTFFGRMPDEGGFAHWLSRLNAGESREAIFAGFANSVEFDELCQAAGIETGSFSYSQTTANLSLVFERNAGTHRRK
ncbi:MAG: DUF4214 domain-containing protein [Oscillospiraceae bacterium]|nr:DUF4214 domain-containing protein [Oscillospiraceae bacterium]